MKMLEHESKLDFHMVRLHAPPLLDFKNRMKT